MTTPAWQPGTLYAPGSVVRRNSLPAIVAAAPVNADFEAGDTGWTKDAPWTISNTFDHTFDGTWGARARGTKGDFRMYSATAVDVLPGLSITASCRFRRASGGVSGKVQLEWLDASNVSIRIDNGNVIDNSTGTEKWRESTVTGVAPANAAKVRVGAQAHISDTDVNLHCDAFKWNYAYQPPIDSLVYKAVQASPGYSGGTEPVWPSTLGLTVVDNDVTWEAIDSSSVTWEASPILVSGSIEPVFPTDEGAQVADNTIAWETIARRVEDERCPNSGIVVIAAQKVFCADGDIVAFSATVNPLDWSSPDDAGYLPFGMQAHGSTPVTALGLYRSNVVAFNGKSFQMWQVDPDPQNMALLDTVPIGTEYDDTLQPFQNDLMLLTAAGVRNIGIAGASTNLQAGGLGKPVDPLVKEYLLAGEYAPNSTYVPGYGQYWLMFGPDSVVLTINGDKRQSWSRYRFPQAVTDTTLHDGKLFLRLADGAVVYVEEDEVDDDVYCQPAAPVLTLTPASAASPSATLDWTIPDYEETLAGFLILRGRGDSLLAKIAEVGPAVTHYVDSPVDLDVFYTYAIVAVPADETGINSPPSNYESVQYFSLTQPVLSGSWSITNAVLNWTAATAVAGAVSSYEVWRSIDGGAFEQIATVDDAILTYTDVSPPSGSTHSYKIRARSTIGATRDSNILLLTSSAVYLPSGWTNPGAEAGLYTGWTLTQGTFIRETGPPLYSDPTAHIPVGSYNWRAGTTIICRMNQEFTTGSTGIADAVVDAGDAELVIDWWGGTWEQGTNDQPRIDITFFNGSNVSIGTATTGYRDPTAIAAGSWRWQHYVDVFAVPANTRKIRIELVGKLRNGSNNDARFDEVQPFLREV